MEKVASVSVLLIATLMIAGCALRSEQQPLGNHQQPQALEPTAPENPNLNTSPDTNPVINPNNDVSSPANNIIIPNQSKSNSYKSTQVLTP